MTERGKLTDERLNLIRRYMGEEEAAEVSVPAAPVEIPKRRRRPPARRRPSRPRTRPVRSNRRSLRHRGHAHGRRLALQWVVTSIVLGIVVGVLVARVL
jgi:hypothetical protein